MVAIPAGFSPQDYLALERQNIIRHEFRRGLVYAMAGSSDSHNRICINLLTEINIHLRDRECEFFSGDVKVNYADDFFYYPDAFVTCDPRDRNDRYIKRYPKLIIEVLSLSTEQFDRNEKFADYQKLPSLQEYILIAQEKVEVECHRRIHNISSQQEWKKQVYQAGDRVVLSSIDLELAIEDLYRGANLGR